MKLKSRIIGALGAGVLTATSLATIVGCTCHYQPQGEYAAPQVSQPGISFMTRKGETTCEITGFKLSRDLYSGEKVNVSWEVKESESSNGVDIKDIKCGYVSANELKINVELDGVQQYEAAKVVFNVSFIFTYGEDEQSSVVPKDLTLNYTPDFEANKVIKSEELPEIKSVNRGDTSFEIEQDSSPFKLNIPLRDHERVRVETTNPYIKANVGIMQVGDKKIPLTLTVDEPSRVEQHTYNFDLLFTVTMDSAAEGPADKITGLTFDYKPYWRNVGVTFQGKTLMIAPEERGGESASMTQNFLLSRKLYAETDEDYDVKVINPTTKEDLQGTVFDYTWEQTGDRYISLNLNYLGAEESTKYIPFKVTFTFTDNIGGAEPLSTVTLPYEADDETTFTFVYTPGWQENYARWKGTDSDRIIVTPEANPSADFGTNTSKFIKLHRNLVEGVENLNVSLVSQNNVLTLGSWEIVTITGSSGDEYYLWLKNITNTNPIDFPEVTFSISIDFLEDGNVMHHDGEKELGKFQFVYTPKSAPEPHVEILIPNGQTEPGRTKLSITAPLTAAIPADATLKAAPTSAWSDTIEIENDGGVLSADRKSITFDIHLKAITDEMLYTADIPYNDVIFEMTLTKDGSDTIFDSNKFNITFIMGEDPRKEDEDVYMDDRTFSFVCYEDKGTNTIPYTQSAFILSKDTKAGASKPYQYYVATTWTYKRQYENVAKNAAAAGNNFVVGVTDSSLHHIHKYSKTKGIEPTLEIEGSKWNDENDYLTFNNPAQSIIWENESNFKNKHTTKVAGAYSQESGSANIFVAKIDFGDIVNKNGNGWIKQKLDLLNAWQKNTTDNPSGRINNFVDLAVLQTDSDAYFNNFYAAGYPTYDYYFSKTANKTEPITVFDRDMYYNDEAAIPGAQPSRNRQTFYPYYYQTAQRSWNHQDQAIGSYNFITDMNHICPSYHTMTGDAGWWAREAYWFGQLYNDVAYLSPGSMMVAKDRRTKQLYLLGMYVGLMYLNSDYRYYSTTDYYYMPWFDSYVNHNDEKWGGSGVINIFEHYYEDKQ